MFEPSEIKLLLDAAGPQLKAMILLGINVGFGNTDCASLPLSAIDLEAGWVSYARPKTGVDRRAKLWDETVDALREVLARRKEPKDEAHAGLVFITKPGGCWAKDTCDNPVTKEFAKLLKETGLVQRGRNFYALRHVFRTIADGCRDFPAIDRVMGHCDESMADRYRERIDDTRLEAVATHVHAWLYPAEKKAAKPRKPASKRKAKPAPSTPKPAKGDASPLRIFAG
jgi:integrase